MPAPMILSPPQHSKAQILRSSLPKWARDSSEGNPKAKAIVLWGDPESWPSRPNTGQVAGLFPRQWSFLHGGGLWSRAPGGTSAPIPPCPAKAAMWSKAINPNRRHE